LAVFLADLAASFSASLAAFAASFSASFAALAAAFSASLAAFAASFAAALSAGDVFHLLTARINDELVSRMIVALIIIANAIYAHNICLIFDSARLQ
jgi:hypothetical protein